MENKNKELKEKFLLSILESSKGLSKEMAELSKDLESKKGVVNIDKRIKSYCRRINILTRELKEKR